MQLKESVPDGYTLPLQVHCLPHSRSSHLYYKSKPFLRNTKPTLLNDRLQFAIVITPYSSKARKSILGFLKNSLASISIRQIDRIVTIQHLFKYDLPNLEIVNT